MSIEIKAIALENWLVYEGTVTLEFGKPEPGKNMWVVHGLNGTGKTSLLKAIRWVFRNGPLAEKFFEGPALHNRQAVRSGNPHLSVTIHFVHRGRDCVLTRSQTAIIRDGAAKGINAPNLTLVIDGKDESSAADDKLAKMLPWDCQQFAFFDGLEIQSYAQKQHSAETRAAIELILGIPEIRNLREDLKKLQKDLERERDDALESMEEHRRLLEEKDQLESDQQGWEQAISDRKNNLNSLDLIIRDLERQASQLARSQERIKELHGKERFAEELKENIRGLDQKQLGLTSRAPIYLVQELLKSRLRRLEDERVRGEVRAKRHTEQKVRRQLIEEILETGRCLCNNQISQESTAFLEAQLARPKIPNEPEEGPAREIPGTENVIIKLRTLLGRLEEDKADPHGIQLLRLQKEQTLEEVEQDIARLREQLKEDADTDVQSLYQALDAQKASHKEADEALRHAQWELDQVNKRLESLQRQLTGSLSGTVQYEALKNELEYVWCLQKAADELVDRFIHDRRATIEANLNRVFQNITNKPQEYDQVALLEDFSLRVVTKAGNYIEPEHLSAGEKEVLAFSFIAGLNLASDNPAPLVMDTPFGHLDIHHRNGLLAALPNLPNQAILLATDRDLPPAERKRFERNLAGEFELYRVHHEERTTIRPL